MSIRRNTYTINDAIDAANQTRREEEARSKAQWQQTRADAALKSFQREVFRDPGPSAPPTITYSSGTSSRSDGGGNSVGIALGIILALVICGYALTHGVPLMTIVAIASWIGAAVAAIAIAFAVIAFVRAFAGPIIVIGCVGWYLWAHFHG